MNILLVDGNAAYARSYYAGQSISSDPREAIRLSLNTVLMLLDPYNDKLGVPIDRTLFAWDGQQNTEKGREPKPQVYHDTKAVLMDMLAFMLGTVNVEHPAAEGDDIVATAVRQAAPEDTVYVVSSDKDLMQLVSSRCHYYSLTDKCVLQPSFILNKFHGIKRPSHVALELAIVGDPVDNIQGVHKFGKVKCKKLFEAVTKDMPFEAAMNALTTQMTPEQQEQFFFALDRTLLKMDVEGVPEPAPLKLPAPSEIEAFDMSDVERNYRMVYRAYR